MKKFKKVIIYSLIITLPISVFFFVWSYQTVNTYSKFKFHFLSSVPKDKLLNTGKFYFFYLGNLLLNQEEKSLSDINLFIDNSKLSELNANIPESGFIEKKGYILNKESKNINKVKLRYRGDNAKHWLFPYKSWRVKAQKDDLYNNARKLNYMNPNSNDMLTNHLSFVLAKQIGLLAPESELVTFSVNGKNQGVRLFAEQLDESFLRKNGRMPNDIYKGENVGSDHVFGAPLKIWKGSYLWQKASYNNHYDKNNTLPLDTMLQTMVKHDFNILSLQDFALFSTFLSLSKSYHYDGVHNWRLYYDNYYEKMYPLVWDARGWWKSFFRFEGTDVFTTDLMQLLSHDYRFLYHRQKYFYEYFSSHHKYFISSLGKVTDDAIAKAKKIPFSFNAYIDVKTKEETIKEIKLFKKTIINHLNNVKKDVFSYSEKDYKYSTSSQSIRISLTGRQIVNKIKINLYNNTNHIENAVMSYNIDNVIHKINVTQKLTKQQNSIILDIPLLSKINRTKNVRYLDFEEATYDIIIDGINSNEDIESIQFKLLDLNNTTIKVAKVDKLEEKQFHNVFHVLDESLERKVQTWSGIKVFKEFTIIKDDIIIKPGTKIVFDQNATLKALGKVTAIGTKEKPIIFEAKDKSKPWNAFALKDAKANGSVFKHCIFKDGSGDKGDLYEYTAMFSVHNVKGLLVEDCEFYDSHRTDDMVHVIYSDATFRNTKFVRSLSDALDVDISNVVVDNCEFIDSGNDSIDLMTTNAIVTNTKFTNSADKGISIGEGSKLLAVNNLIKGSEIGMQSKDTSKAYIYNTSFIGNKKAVDAYHKNWRYSEGGTIYLDKCIFDKNVDNATVGKKSKVVINDSSIDTPEKIDTKSLKKKKIIISDDSFIMYDLKEPLFKDKTHLIVKERRGYHE